MTENNRKCRQTKKILENDRTFEKLSAFVFVLFCPKNNGVTGFSNLISISRHRRERERANANPALLLEKIFFVNFVCQQITFN